jgi:hypothetical protein
MHKDGKHQPSCPQARTDRLACIVAASAGTVTPALCVTVKMVDFSDAAA